MHEKWTNGFGVAKANPGIDLDVDLESARGEAGEKTYRFTIDAFRRHCMMNGLDSIGLPCSTTPPSPT